MIASRVTAPSLTPYRYLVRNSPQWLGIVKTNICSSAPQIDIITDPLSDVRSPDIASAPLIGWEQLDHHQLTRK